MSDRLEQSGYGQFCPVAMAAEIVGTRWTLLVLRELLCGSTRFNDLRRGVPRMSPTLLSKRLKELTEAGVVAAEPGPGGIVEYRLTEAGKDLHDIVMSVGLWGHRWVQSSLTLKNLDPSLLMWDMRRNLRPEPLPPRRCTVLFTYPELDVARRQWWLVIENGAVDLCRVDPGHDVDLHVRGSLRDMTAVWMGHTTLKDEIAAGRIEVSGNSGIARSIHQWLGLSPFAKEKRRVAN